MPYDSKKMYNEKMLDMLINRLRTKNVITRAEADNIRKGV